MMGFKEKREVVGTPRDFLPQTGNLFTQNC